MNVVVFDCGNAILKAKTAQREAEFPHAMLELTEAEYQDIRKRAGQPGPGPDYLRINGQPYVVGESAERHGTVTRKRGAARYSREYYGVLMCAMLARIYQTGGDVALFGSHAPGDMPWRDSLLDSALDEWHVEIDGGERYFRVIYVNAFEEPKGGLMNVMLAKSGRSYARTDINGGRSLVIDIGGYTTDFLGVNPGGQVDYGLAISEQIGINRVVDQFRSSIHASNPDLFQSGPGYPEQYRAALTTGTFKGGGRSVNVANEAREATSALLNQIDRSYQERAGGPVKWDAIILTGGGSAMLYDRLLPIVGHDNVILADDPADIHLANVRGGMKLWRMLSHYGGL